MLLLAPTQGAASKSLYENDLQFLPKTSLNSTLAQHQQYKQLLSLMLPLRLKTLQSAMTFGPHSKFFWNPGPLPSEETLPRASGPTRQSRPLGRPPDQEARNGRQALRNQLFTSKVVVRGARICRSHCG